MDLYKDSPKAKGKKVETYLFETANVKANYIILVDVSNFDVLDFFEDHADKIDHLICDGVFEPDS